MCCVCVLRPLCRLCVLCMLCVVRCVCACVVCVLCVMCVRACVSKPGLCMLVWYSACCVLYVGMCLLARSPNGAFQNSGGGGFSSGVEKNFREGGGGQMPAPSRRIFEIFSILV